jgi:hypothetical protein
MSDETKPRVTVTRSTTEERAVDVEIEMHVTVEQIQQDLADCMRHLMEQAFHIPAPLPPVEEWFKAQRDWHKFVRDSIESVWEPEPEPPEYRVRTMTRLPAWPPAEGWRLLPVDFESFEYTPPTLPSCDCGAEKARTTHADWCSTTGAR